MQPEQRQAITPQLVIGIFLTLLGLTLTLERLEVLASGHLRVFWPLALIALGIALLIRRQDSRGRFWGSFWTLSGGWLLLKAVGLITVGPFELIVPLIFILIGGTMVSRTLWGPARPPDAGRRPAAGPDTGSSGSLAGFKLAGAPRSDPNGRISLFAIMGEAKRASNDKPFRGGEITAVMGGCILDLRQAEIAPGDRVTINVVAVMAGHEIWVPPTWTVAADVVPLLGGTDDKRLPPLAPLAPDAPTLVLKGFVLMGGIVIKN